MSELKFFFISADVEGRAAAFQSFAEAELKQQARTSALRPGANATKGIDPQLLEALQATAYVVTIVAQTHTVMGLPKGLELYRQLRPQAQKLLTWAKAHAEQLLFEDADGRARRLLEYSEDELMHELARRFREGSP